MAQNVPILICHLPKIHIFLFGGDCNRGIETTDWNQPPPIDPTTPVRGFWTAPRREG